jgi:hypothetical protein
LTAIVPLAAAPSAGASTQPAGGQGAKVSGTGTWAQNVADPHLIALEKKQQVLHVIAGNITQNLSESDRAKIPGFTEIVVDAEHNQLHLYWKGTPPRRVTDILRHLPSGVTADVRPARYSKAELHTARDKLLRGGQPVALRIASSATPVRITSIGPAVDGSGLEVGYDEGSPANRPSSAAGPAPTAFQSKAGEIAGEVKAAVDRATGANTVVTYSPAPRADASSAPSASSPAGVPVSSPRAAAPAATAITRSTDAAPWNGGAALLNPIPGGGICSSGFGVKDAHGHSLITAARHCNGGNGRWRTWNGGSGGAPVGTTSSVEQSLNDDTVGISLTAPTSGRLYDGAANLKSPYTKPVVGWGHNNVGERVCEDGANGGIHCGLTIRRTDFGITGSNGRYRPDVDQADSAVPNVAGVNGDSGGPVFAGLNVYTQDQARGTVTLFGGTITCPANLNPNTVLDGHKRAPWCFKTVYYIPISLELSDMKWTLVTK